jgi:hypothetical protein
MKKLIILILLCTKVANAEVCANAHGQELIGVNGVRYCYTNMSMNWWSAHAWCDAIGMKMIDPNEDCACNGFDGCDTSLKCPNLKASSSTEYWTASQGSDASTIYVVVAWHQHSLANRSKTHKLAVMCK